ncbi:MAG: hypothetical protein GY796_13400 [Chloroflexi bacterium]|nr:hypothetical protein [Chloroflexota bacterium]
MDFSKRIRILFTLFLPLVLLTAVIHTLQFPAQAQTPIGYGFNVAEWDIATLQGMGFNWMKVFSGPGSRLPVNILLRIDANASKMSDVNGFGDFVEQLANQQKGFVDAYEIGNEPNLDASYGWTTSPNAADYAMLLCEAYGRIKTVDPAAKVISAGLAPTGRVTGNWNGHPGHNGLFQDEREFFKEFAAAGGSACLDGVGYHPYGYSADYDAEPDVASADSTQNCANGFCFRGAEKLYELMQSEGMSDKTMWATEYGWIVSPSSHCLSDPGWQGRQWQIVSEQKQADNLVGSFTYAAANYSWMEAMFIFNLNFNTAPWLDECEQMRFYGVVGRPAQTALTDMPKEIPPPSARQLEVTPAGFTSIITPGQQPYSQTTHLHLTNSGDASLQYTMTVTGTAVLTITLTPPISGNLTPGEIVTIPLTIDAPILLTGTYSSAIQINTTSVGLTDIQTIPITRYIWDTIRQAVLPVILKP